MASQKSAPRPPGEPPNPHGETIATRKSPSAAAPADDLQDLLESFELSLRAGQKAPRTLEVYGDSVRQFIAFQRGQGMPTDIADVTREHVEKFEVSLQEAGRKPATISVRHRALHAFFKWAATEGAVACSPMASMPAPIVPEAPVPVPRVEDLRRLLAATAGRSFEKLRDAALLRFYIDTGVRAAEGIGLKLSDIDLKAPVPLAMVMGKGRRPRAVPISPQTAVALDRYLRARKSHPHQGLDWLWLGSKGHLTTSGLRQLLERRCDQAGIPRIHPHQLRHYFAHAWLAQAGAESELMALTGWKSRAMLSRYAASTVAERAAESHRRMGILDRLQ